MTTVLEAARRYVVAGLSVIPIRYWTKEPDYRTLGLPDGQPLHWETRTDWWKPYTERMPTDAELVRWFEGTNCQLGIVGGAISGGLVRLDFEHRACLHTWSSDLLTEDPVLVRAIAPMPIVQTPKGFHVYFRMPDPPGHIILCSHGSGDSQIVFSETQGEGCYCLAPPSSLYTMESGDFRYGWVGLTGPETIPTLDQEVAQKLIEAARFPGFWTPTFAAPWGPRAGEVTRNGINLMDGHNPGGGNLWFDWPHLRALQVYLDRYATLLRAVETAPPLPPSFE